MEKLKRNFYERNTLIVAKELLGKILIHSSQDGETVGKIVETEAYIGPNDKGSHAYNSLRTKRTEIQYGQGGFAYIYQIYGKNFCFNIVTQKMNMPEVVLIRALEPLNGIDLMIKRRKIALKDIVNLANGPGKLCSAMGIDKSLYGADLCGDKLYLLKSEDEGFIICSTPRINIEYALESKKYPWRFLIKNNIFVSRPIIEKNEIGVPPL